MDAAQPGPSSPEFVRLVDLASRRMGASVVAANDELFAERENLIKPDEPTHQIFSFGHKGQLYDGWETRRRREPGHDWAIVRLGMPGVVHGVVVDTAFFTGNYPPQVSVEAALVEGYPTPDELSAADWFELVPRSDAAGDRMNSYPVTGPRRLATHVRLCMYPDGGVARLRVHGEVVPDPRLLLPGAVDLAALENGGDVTECSNMFYSSPRNLISPGPDTRHRFPVEGGGEVTHVRVDVYPDGGMARVRIWGDLSASGREAQARRWQELTLPR